MAVTTTTLFTDGNSPDTVNFAPAAKPQRVQGTLYARGTWNKAALEIRPQAADGISYLWARFSEPADGADLVVNIDLYAYEIDFNIVGGNSDTALDVILIDSGAAA